MSPSPLLSLRNAALGYRKKGRDLAVLSGLSFDFFAGELIGIAGLNGIGKSTLLRSLSGLQPLLAGQAYVDGLDIASLPLEALAKKTAVVLTEKITGFNLRAYDVVAAGQVPYTNAFHQLKEEHLAVVDAAIAACGITRHQHKLLGELSDGLFQKTIIAKALAQQTPVMLLDEPSAFLDYASKHELFLLLKKLAETEGKCILVSTHDLDLSLKYCHKLLVIGADAAELVPAAEARQNKIFQAIGGGFI
jgi:iron complex transport system ATP-binding protein